MEFIIAILFGALVSTATIGTQTQKDCKENFDYKPKACKPAKILEDLGKVGK
jgi:hypothetical protein